MLRNMTETPSSSEPATTPVATSEPVAAAPVTPPVTQQPVVQEPRRPSRLMQTAAWVGITAGIVFIVAVVFGAGFFLGAHSDGGHPRGGGGFHDRPGMMMFHRGGPPPMGQLGPGMFGPGGPDFGPGGPGFRLPAERPEAPSTAAPARP